MVWYKHGSKTLCGNCGEWYIQDQPQEWLDDPNEAHPDARLVCPKCRLYFSAFDYLKNPKTENEMMLALHLDHLHETIKQFKIDFYMDKERLENSEFTNKGEEDS